MSSRSYVESCARNMADSEIEKSRIAESVSTDTTYDANERSCNNFVAMMLLLLFSKHLLVWRIFLT